MKRVHSKLTGTNTTSAAAGQGQRSNSRTAGGRNSKSDKKGARADCELYIKLHNFTYSVASVFPDLLLIKS